MTFVFRAMCAVGALAVLGCTEPRSGLFAEGWCKPTIAEASLVIDDMEDGDAVLCPPTKGNWYVAGQGTFTPVPGDIRGAQELSPARAESFRAQHLAGSVDAGGAGILGVRLGDMDLSAFNEIRFWARSDAGPLEMYVALSTATTAADGDHFVDVATIAATWGTQGTPNSIALTALMKSNGQLITDDDRISTKAIEFQLRGEAPSFGLWIDDVQLIPKP